MSFVLAQIRKILPFRNQHQIPPPFFSAKGFNIQPSALCKSLHTKTNHKLNVRVKVRPVNDLPPKQTPKYIGGLYTPQKMLVWPMARQEISLYSENPIRITLPKLCSFYLATSI